MSILAGIAKWFIGGGISSIGAQINEGIKIRENAKNNESRIAAEQNIARLETVRDLEIARLEARANEKPSLITQILRILAGTPLMLVLLKMCADYISVGVIDPVPHQLWWALSLFLGWLFFGNPAAPVKK